MGFAFRLDETKKTKKTGKKKGTSKNLKLARTQPSRTRAKRNAKLYNALKTFNETKLIPTIEYTDSNPQAIQPGSTTFWWGGVLGPETIPAVPWTGTWNPLGGIGTIQGNTATQRDGNYIYLNKTHATFQIDMNARDVENSSVHEFRVILFKTRRGTNPVARYPDPTTQLFLDSLGNPFGHASLGFDGFDIMLHPLNKRQFVIFKDMRFCMTPQMANNVNLEGVNQKYDSFKRMPMNMNHKIKCRIPLPEDPGTFGYPSNYDYFYGMAIYSRSVNAGGVNDANQWKLSTRGTTSWMDS